MSEQEIRKGLEKQFGVEFYDPDDPEINEDVSQIESSEVTKQGQVKAISVNKLIEECNKAVKDEQNPYRLLIWNCGFVIKQLCDRLAEIKKQEEGDF